jgi:hypothetical protein
MGQIVSSLVQFRRPDAFFAKLVLFTMTTPTACQFCRHHHLPLGPCFLEGMAKKSSDE